MARHLRCERGKVVTQILQAAEVIFFQKGNQRVIFNIRRLRKYTIYLYTSPEKKNIPRHAGAQQVIRIKNIIKGRDYGKPFLKWHGIICE